MLDYSSYLKIAKSKFANKWYKTMILAILAGMFIALAGAGSTIVSYKVANASLAKLLSGIIFPIGLILVVLLQTELFTGNSLLLISVLKKEARLRDLLKNWTLVFIGNLLGSLLVSVLICYSGLLSNQDLNMAIYKTLINKTSYSFINAFVLGILCNFLVCIAVFLASNGKTPLEKIAVIFFPICLFIILGFEHSIANMYFLSLGYFSSLNESITIGKILLSNMLPVTLGNIVGGTAFASTVYFLNKK